MERVASALITVIIGVGGAILYFYLSNLILDAIFSARGKGPEAARNQKIAATIRPWLFLGPALIALGLYLVYPLVDSVRLSLFNRTGETFVGLQNYVWAVNDTQFRESIFNNILWLLVVPALATFLGLVIAFLTDRIWWGNIAKTLIFMPMAISFVGASVIWKFIYDYRSEGSTQIGLLNAIVQAFGGIAGGLDHRPLLEQLLPDGDPRSGSRPASPWSSCRRRSAAFPTRRSRRR